MLINILTNTESVVVATYARHRHFNRQESHHVSKSSRIYFETRGLSKESAVLDLSADQTNSVTCQGRHILYNYITHHPD